VLRGGVLLGTSVLGGLAVGACGADNGGTTDAGDAATPDNALLAAFPQSVPHVAVGVPARLPYLISDGEGVPLATIDGPVRFTVTKDGEPVGDPVEVAPRTEGVPRAYLPLGFTFPEPAIYEVRAEYGGATLDSSLQVYPATDVGPPLVGEALPPVDTPTTTRTLQVDPICTRVPACPYHEANLQDVVGRGAPVVLLVSTPAYCQTGVCGPILDTMMALAPDHPGVTFIHSEVYKNPKEVRDLADATLAPVPDAYQLRFEPTMFVADAAGTILARADIVIDTSEMKELLALV
jgi:hypothetical protein